MDETKLFRVVAVGGAILFAGVRNEDLTFTGRMPLSRYEDPSLFVEAELIKNDRTLAAARYVLGLTAKSESPESFWVIDVFLRDAKQSDVNYFVYANNSDEGSSAFVLSLEDEAEIRRLLEGKEC